MKMNEVPMAGALHAYSPLELFIFSCFVNGVHLPLTMINSVYCASVFSDFSPHISVNWLENLLVKAPHS
jgi:hypothetical protein